MRFKLTWLLTITSVFVLLLSSNLVSAEDLVDKSPYYNGLGYPGAVFNKGIEPPYSLNGNSEETIDPVTGAINIKVNDISLKGRNGLDFSLSRYYTQNNSALYEPYVYPGYTYTLLPEPIDLYYVQVKVKRTKIDLNSGNSIGDSTVTILDELGPYLNTSYAQPVIDEINDIEDEYSDVYYDKETGKCFVYLYDYYSVVVTRPTYYYLSDIDYVNKLIVNTDNHKFSDLGAGWQFDLPYIEDIEGYKYLHYGSAGTWQIDFKTSGDSHLKDYPLKDIKLNNDSWSYYNGQMYSAYVLEQKDGKKTYFGSDGRLLGIKDRFDNEIRFQHDTSEPEYPLLNKIIDSVGREINITYSGSKVLITINDETNPDNNRTIKYNKATVPEVPANYVLEYVIDAENRQTKYQYSINSANINLVEKDLSEGVLNVYACLTKIIMPTKGETCYSYTKSTKNCGTDGIMEVYKLNERYESKNDGVNYNYKKFNYLYGETGEYDGYPNYSSDASIPDSYIIKTQVVDGLNNSEIYTYNKKMLPINIIQEGTNHKYETINEYDSVTRLLLKTVNKTFNKATGALMQSVQNYTYDTTGYRDLLEYWDSQAARDSSNMPTNNEHKVTYTYQSTYHYPLTKVYNRDASTTVKEEYTPASDLKAIQQIKIYENSVLKGKTQYNYDSYGNIIEEKKYLDDGVNSISTYYSYNDNNSARNGKFNGAYLTRKWNNNVKNIDELENNLPGITVEETFKYDWFGNIIEKKDGNGNTTAYEFDKLGRAKKETHQDGTYKTWQYTTDSLENSVVISDENKSKIKNLYDQFGNIMCQVDVASGQNLNQYTYDSQMRLKTESNQNTSLSYGTNTYNYDSIGRLLEKITKNQQDTVIAKESYSYDDACDNGLYNKVTKTILGETGSPSITAVEYTNKLGQVEKSGTLHNGTEYLSTFKYDYLGNKTEEKSARAYDEGWSQAYTAKYDYNYQGNVVKQYNINGDYTTSTYDTLGRLKAVTDIKGNKAAVPYSTTYEYDNLGRLIKETVPFDNSSGTIVNSVKKYYYDSNGNRIKERTLSNKPGEAESYNTTGYEYNTRNMLTKVVTYDEEAAENYTQYYYDAAGNKIRMYTGLSAPLQIAGTDNVTPTADADYSVTKYEYDRFNRLIKLTDPINMNENYTYDLNGNMLQKTDKNGSTISMTYDGMGRMLTNNVLSTENPSLNAGYSYTYTLTGSKKTMSGGGTNTAYNYDDLGRLITEEVSDGSRKEYTYDTANNRKSLKLSQNGAVKTNTAYTYDNLNRLGTVLENGALTATYTYDENGNRKALTCSNGNLTKYTYNLANKLLTLPNENGSTVFAGYTYTYYLNGNQASKTDNRGKVTAYTYDGLGRITSESSSSEPAIKYTYDDSSNRETMTEGDNTTTLYEYDKNNRLLEETKVTGSDTAITTYRYDSNGNQMSKTTGTLKPAAGGEAASLEASAGERTGSTEMSFNEYNGFNQLIKTETGETTAKYAYNADGLRTSKTVNGIKTNHVWDGNQIALETDGSGNVTNKYVRGINLLYAENAAGAKQYYMFNGHGDVVQLTGADGVLTKRYDYDAFGNEKNPDANDTNVFRYCGEYFDKETGTIYLRARYYDPTIGRFITEDSYWGKDSDPLSLNLYTYCGNNPIMYVDSTGHEYTTLKQLINTSEGGSFETHKGYVTVNAYGKSVDIKYDTSKNEYKMANVNGTMYMDRAEFLRMMGVDAIATSSGKYEISSTNAHLRTALANAPVFVAGVYIGAEVSPAVIAYVSASQYAEIIKSAASKVKKLGSVAGGLFAIEVMPSIEVEAGTYVEEHFMVRYGNGLIHSIGVITQLNENDAVESSISTSSVSPVSWGIPWNQRVGELRNSMPNSTVIKIN